MLIIANLFILSVFTLPQCTFKNLRDVCGCLCDGKCWSLNVRRNSPMMWFDTPHVVGEVGRSCFNGDSGGGTPASNQCFAKVGPHETTRIWDTDGSKICGHIGTGVHEGDPFVKFCDSVLTRHPRQYQATVGVQCCSKLYCSECAAGLSCTQCLDGDQPSAGECREPICAPLAVAGCATNHLSMSLNGSAVCAEFDAPLVLGQRVQLLNWNGADAIDAIDLRRWTGTFNVLVLEYNNVTGSVWALTLRRFIEAFPGQVDADQQDAIILFARPNCSSTIIFNDIALTNASRIGAVWTFEANVSLSFSLRNSTHLTRSSTTFMETTVGGVDVNSTANATVESAQSLTSTKIDAASQTTARSTNVSPLTSFFSTNRHTSTSSTPAAISSPTTSLPPAVVAIISTLAVLLCVVVLAAVMGYWWLKRSKATLS